MIGSQTNDTVEGFVSHVSDDGRIYCHLMGPGNERLHEMQQELQRLYAQVLALHSSVRPLVCFCLVFFVVFESLFVKANYDDCFEDNEIN